MKERLKLYSLLSIPVLLAVLYVLSHEKLPCTGKIQTTKFNNAIVCSEPDPDYGPTIKKIHIFYRDGREVHTIANSVFTGSEDIYCFREVDPYHIVVWVYRADGTREYIGTFIR